MRHQYGSGQVDCDWFGTGGLGLVIWDWRFGTGDLPRDPCARAVTLPIRRRSTSGDQPRPIS